MTRERELMAERDAALADQRRRAQRMKVLHEVSTKETADVEQALRDVLTHSCYVLDMELGLISRIQGQEYVVKYSGNDESHELEGNIFELGETYCSLALTRPEHVLAIDHMARSEFSGHPCYETFHLESYIGVGLYVGGALHDTLTFSSSLPRATLLDHIDFEYMEILGGVVASMMAQRMAEERIRRERDFLEGLADLQRRLAASDHGTKRLLDIAVTRGRRLLGAPHMSASLTDGTHAVSSSPLFKGIDETCAHVEAPLTFDQEQFGVLRMTLPSENRRRDRRPNLALVAGVAAARLRDLSKARRVEQESRTDPLTKALNRRGFLATAQETLVDCTRRGAPLALAVFDLDHFK